jgi:hypothetical protein
MQILGEVLERALDSWAVAYSVAPLCESPIEAELGGALATVLRRACRTTGVLEFAVCLQDQQHSYSGRYLFLIPQFSWKRWRFDFAIKFSHFAMPQVFIECDGKEFHRTAKQLANDRRKDAEAERIGVKMFRFSGARIFRDTQGCVAEILRRF